MQLQITEIFTSHEELFQHYLTLNTGHNAHYHLIISLQYNIKIIIIKNEEIIVP